MPGLFTITFPDLPSTVQAAIAIDDDMASLLQDNGYDPSKINTVSWPAVGASQHCSALFLVHNKTLDALNTAGHSNAPIRLNFGGLIFDRMYLRAPRPLLPGNLNSTKAVHLYLVELVDERFFWGQQSINAELGGWEGNVPAMFKHGINMTVPGKRAELIYQTTFYGSPWSTFTIMDEMIASGFEYWHINPDEWELDFDGLNNIPDIRDMHLTGQPIGNFIDFLATVSGGVVLAYPNSIGGSRYRIVAIGGSHDQNVVFGTMQGYTASNSSRLKTGGFYPFFGAGGGAAGSSISTVPYSTIREEVPAGVAVYFPKVVDDLNYTEDVSNNDWNADFPFPQEPGRYNYSTDRWKVLFSTTNRPSHNNGDNRWISVFTHHHAIFKVEEQEGWDGEPFLTEEWTNQLNCAFHANRTASRYYRRFYCMPCDATWVGIIGNPDDPQTSQVAIWSGSQVITWSYTSDGPMTHIQGDYNHPLFGFQRDKPLTQMDLMSSGVIRTMPSISGGVHIDAPFKAPTLDLFHAKITGVSGDVETGWLYSAEAYNDKSIKVTDIEPIRDHDPSTVDITALEVGDNCIIGLIPPPEGSGRSRNSASETKTSAPNEHTYPNIPTPKELNPRRITDYNVRTLLGPQGDSTFNDRYLSMQRSLTRSAVEIPRVGNYYGMRRSTENPNIKDNGEEYVLFVWEKPETIECSEGKEPPGRAANSFVGFFGSIGASMGGY
jgi:hypothetical protein